MVWRDWTSLGFIALLGMWLIRTMPNDVKRRDRGGLSVWSFYALGWFGLLYLLGRVTFDV